MADTKISAFAALTGAGVDSAADVLAIVDTDAGATKKILVDELRISLSATQAFQEAATNVSTFVTPGRQHFHPSAPKAWGVITSPTTVSLSYPSAGVSNTNPSLGNFVVTHGRTFSSAVYAVFVMPFHATNKYSWSIQARDATTFTVQFWDNGGGAQDVTSFSYQCDGDL